MKEEFYENRATMVAAKLAVKFDGELLKLPANPDDLICLVDIRVILSNYDTESASLGRQSVFPFGLKVEKDGQVIFGLRPLGVQPYYKITEISSRGIFIESNSDVAILR